MFKTIRKTLFFLLSSIAFANAGSLKVMTLNIRQDTATDVKERDWDKRLPLVAKTIKSASIVGLQEAHKNQIVDLERLLTNYAWAGVGRNDGKSNGEHCPIFFDKTQWKKVDGGTIWLSNTPSKPGSRHWGNQIPRICTWIRLMDKNGAGIYVYNSHLDHRSKPSREKSSKLIVQFIKQRKYIDEPVLLLGDFNATYQTETIRHISGARDVRGKLLVDSYLAAKPQDKNPATYNHWNPKHKGLGKIDYIFNSPDLILEESRILNVSEGITVISDHWPQIASFTWNPEQQLNRIEWRYFKETAIDKEFGDGDGVVIRWTAKEIPIRLMSGTAKQKETLAKVIKELNEALLPTGVRLTSSTNLQKNEIRCYIDTFKNLKKASASEGLNPPPDYAGYASLRWVTNTKVVIQAQVLIAIDRLKPNELYHVLLEELTQCLGLPGDNSVFPESVTFSRGQDHGGAPKLGLMDVKAIRFLYLHLEPGDSEKRVKDIFTKNWKR